MGDSKVINTFLAVVPAFTTALYLMGHMYNAGFLGAYGVGDSQFPMSSDVTLLYGFYALIPAALTFKPLLYVALAVIAIVFIVSVAYILAESSRIHALHQKLFSKKLDSNQNNPEIKKRLDLLLEQTEKFYYFFLGLFLILIVFIFLARFAYASGEKTAEKSIDKFKNQKSKWVELYLAGSSQFIRAQQIGCSDMYCAFWLGDKSLILPHDKIEKIVAHTVK